MFSTWTFTSAQYGTWYRSAGAGSRHGASRAANTTAGTCRVVPCTRAFAVTSHAFILDRASPRARKVSPAKKVPCTNYTPATTLGLPRIVNYP